jgi:hypothetical protein
MTASKTKTKTTPAGPDRIPQANRSTGYYRDPETGDKYRSVTTILSQGVPKDALPRWAAIEVATCAMDNIPRLVRAMLNPAERAALFEWLKNAAERKKDERAAIGTAIHKYIECKILGQPIPQELLDDPEIAPYLRMFDQFVDDWAVEFEASEMVVANPDEGYAGTLDYLLRSARIVAALVAADLLPWDADPAVPLMGDTKTGGEICFGDGACQRVRRYVFPKGCPQPGVVHSIKGVYPEAGMQMAAYRASKVAWLRDGSKVPMPATHPVGVVLQLRPDGYLLIPARCDGEVFGKFQHARAVAEWTSVTSKSVVGQALVVPAPLKASA